MEPGNLMLQKFYFPLWRHCVLSGGTRRRSLPLYQIIGMKILNISHTYITSHTYCLFKMFFPESFNSTILSDKQLKCGSLVD